VRLQSGGKQYNIFTTGIGTIDELRKTEFFITAILRTIRNECVV
jgi:hypothetical protein